MTNLELIIRVALWLGLGGGVVVLIIAFIVATIKTGESKKGFPVTRARKFWHMGL